MATVVTGVVVVIVSSPWIWHVLILCEHHIVALAAAFGMGGSQMPCHPVGYLAVFVVRHGITVTPEQLLGCAKHRSWYFHALGSLGHIVICGSISTIQESLGDGVRFSPVCRLLAFPATCKSCACHGHNHGQYDNLFHVYSRRFHSRDKSSPSSSTLRS